MASGGNPEEIKKTCDKNKARKGTERASETRENAQTTEIAKSTRPRRHEDKTRPNSQKSGSASKSKTVTNIIVNGDVEYMQIGNNNTMVIKNKIYGDPRCPSRPFTRQQIKGPNCPRSSNELTESEKENLQLLKDASDNVTTEIMMVVSKIIGRRYKRYGRQLGFTDAQLEDIHHSKMDIGVCEVMYTIIKEWVRKTDNPTLGLLVQQLSEGEDAALIKEILAKLKAEEII